MHCLPPTSAKVSEFTLHCESKTLYLETKTPDGKYKTYEVDLTPLFTGCDGESILIDTRLANPTVSEQSNGDILVSFDIINVVTGDVIGVETFTMPPVTSDHNHDAGIF